MTKEEAEAILEADEEFTSTLNHAEFGDAGMVLISLKEIRATWKDADGEFKGARIYPLRVEFDVIEREVCIGFLRGGLRGAYEALREYAESPNRAHIEHRQRVADLEQQIRGVTNQKKTYEQAAATMGLCLSDMEAELEALKNARP